MIQETQSKALHQPTAKPATAIKRVGYVDTAKGIGIILVVMAHNDFALISPFAYKLIYSLRIQLYWSGINGHPDFPGSHSRLLGTKTAGGDR